MNEFSQAQFSAFFSAIGPWRIAYRRARLHFLAIRKDEILLIISARIFMHAGVPSNPHPHFRGGAIEAGHWDIPLDKFTVEETVLSLVRPEGLLIEEIGTLRLVFDEGQDIFVAPPTLLHPEGLTNGNRLAVLSLTGGHCEHYLPQPESDWLVRAGETPYDTIQELCYEYGLNITRQQRAVVEVIAHAAVEVLATSEVKGTSATLGIWMAGNLEKSKARIGFRVLDRGKVCTRGAISGIDLQWEDEDLTSKGTATFEVPTAAIVQCFASYEGHAHHVQWRADPANFQNPRSAVLSLVDQGFQTMRGYLQPDRPLRSKAADDFEGAIAWLLWVLGFSTASFGTNAKTRDAFDTVAASPNGDFMVVECTLGLLRADSKLSKLNARSARLRELLDNSNMRHLRVLPVLVTAMSADEVRADIPSAEAIGVLVMTKENLEEALEEILRLPDANKLFERAITTVQEKKRTRTESEVHRQIGVPSPIPPLAQ